MRVTGGSHSNGITIVTHVNGVTSVALMTGTDGGKSDSLSTRTRKLQGSTRRRQLADEEVELLDPIDPDDWKLLTFRPNGQPTPAKHGRHART
jgi:hypothetical protein